MKCLLFTLFTWIAICQYALYANLYSEALSDYKTGRLEEALTSINQSIQEAPSAHAQELKGRILADMGKTAQALAAFQKVVDAEPKRGSVHFFIGEVFFSQNRWSEAFGAYRYALELDPTYHASILKMIYCLILMDNFPMAHKWLTTLDPTDDLNPDYYFARAASACVTGTRDDYNNALRQARTIYGTQVFNRYEPDLLRVVKILNDRDRKNTPSPSHPPLNPLPQSMPE